MLFKALIICIQMINLVKNKSFLIFKNIFQCSSVNSKSVPSQIIDDIALVDKKVQTLSSLITSSSYPIIFTGAGISTSIGIPDYRSGAQTIVQTGPGLWNRDPATLSSGNQPKIDKLVDMINPSITHMAIKTLISRGIIKHLISQNTDGLHLRSGVQQQQISELHGNRNLEYCISCGQRYLRDYRTLKRTNQPYKPGEKRQHRTERDCQNCGGQLHDSIIYFGEKLPKEELHKAYYHGKQADLCISIGSSLTVRPSSNIPLLPLQNEKPGKLVIINIQQTPLDKLSELRINYFCDMVMEKLMKSLNIDIQKRKVEHYLQLEVVQENFQTILRIEGKNKAGKNLSFMKQLKTIANGEQKSWQVTGHMSKIPLSRFLGNRVDKQLKITHFGTKKDLQFDLGKEKFTFGIPKRFKYVQSQNQNWNIVEIQ